MIKKKSEDKSEESLKILREACKRKKNKDISEEKLGFVFSMADVEEVIKTHGPVEEKIEPVASKLKIEKPKVEGVLVDDKPKEKRVLSAACMSDILGFDPKKANAKKNVSAYEAIEESKVKEDLKPYYRALIKLRNRLKDELALHTKESLQESSGDLARYNNFDLSSECYEQELTLGMVSAEKETLDEVEAALHRISDGTYGICEITGKPILKQRLQAVPFTRYSIEGQKQLEEKSIKRNGKEQVNGHIFTDINEDDEKYFSESDEESS